MSDERRLGEWVRERLGEPSLDCLRQQRHDVLSRMRGLPRRRVTPARALGVLALAAACVLAVLLRQRDAPVAAFELRGRALGHELVEGQWLDASEGPLPLTFTDQSELRLDRDSRARVTTIRNDRVDVSLEEGHLWVSVRSPHRAVAWVFFAGPFSVEVLGTELTVDWRPDVGRLVVEVAHGVVRVVRGPDDSGVQVHGGERFEAVDGALVLRPADAEEPPSSTASVPPPSAVVAPAPSMVERASPSHRTPEAADWQELAHAGSYREAFELAQRRGLDDILRHAGIDDLVLLADAARLSGAHDEARDVLSAIRERFAGSPEAAMAAFRLGRLSFDDAQYREAARWFAAYREEAVTGSLVEQAHGRELDALRRAGENERAREVASTYLRDYPDGAYRALAEQALSPR